MGACPMLGPCFCKNVEGNEEAARGGEGGWHRWAPPGQEKEGDKGHSTAEREAPTEELPSPPPARLALPELSLRSNWVPSTQVCLGRSRALQQVRGAGQQARRMPKGALGAAACRCQSLPPPGCSGWRRERRPCSVKEYSAGPAVLLLLLLSGTACKIHAPWLFQSRKN